MPSGAPVDGRALLLDYMGRYFNLRHSPVNPLVLRHDARYALLSAWRRFTVPGLSLYGVLATCSALVSRLRCVNVEFRVEASVGVVGVDPV